MAILTTEQRAVLTQRLAEAEQAYHDLSIGRTAVEFHDQNGEKVIYNKNSIRSLLGYINTLKQQLGLNSGSGPLNVWL